MDLPKVGSSGIPQVRENVSLAEFTTIGIGGPARWFLAATSEDELRNALQWATANGHMPLILGGGSNLLIADQGWAGVVIHNAIPGLTLEDKGPDRVRAICGSGVSWDDFVAETVAANLQGVECLSGIPGTVGACPVQNIGAYGQEVKDTIEWVDAIERSSGQVHRFTATECEFSYRWSRFKGDDRDRFVITRVAFSLRRDAQPQLRYGDLTRYFDDKAIPQPTLEQVRNAVLEIRRSKGMVIDPEIPDSRSCGSFFMNPVVTEQKADNVQRIATDAGMIASGQQMPRYPADPGLAKLSAAWLMEKSGMKKGLQRGNVGLSTRHVLAIINRGNGTAAEVLDLVDHVQKTVKARFDIELVPEPVFVGFDNTSC